MNTTDPFTEAREYAEQACYQDENIPIAEAGFRAGWKAARTHLAAQRAEEVRAWAVQQYPSGTPLDQDRRMVAAETEAYLSGRTEREMSELAQAAKHTGPVDPPAQEPTDAEVAALIDSLAQQADVFIMPLTASMALQDARNARRDEEKR